MIHQAQRDSSYQNTSYHLRFYIWLLYVCVCVRVHLSLFLVNIFRLTLWPHWTNFGINAFTYALNDARVFVNGERPLFDCVSFYFYFGRKILWEIPSFFFAQLNNKNCGKNVHSNHDDTTMITFFQFNTAISDLIIYLLFPNARISGKRERREKQQTQKPNSYTLLSDACSGDFGGTMKTDKYYSFYLFVILIIYLKHVRMLHIFFFHFNSSSSVHRLSNENKK